MAFVCLITGASRGLGRALVAQYLSCPDTTVVASVRQPSSEPAKTLRDLSVARGSRLVIVPGDNTSEPTTQQGIEALKGNDIQHLDLVIANAANAGTRKVAMVETDLGEFDDMVRTNGAGTIITFRQALPLMEKASRPCFVNMGSTNGSSTLVNRTSSAMLGAMGATKALSHFITSRLSVEHPEILIFSICPGPVATDGFRTLAGHEQEMHAMSPEKSAKGIRHVIRQAKRVSHQGKFVSSPSGNEIPY